jgi:hypothetical protein
MVAGVVLFRCLSQNDCATFRLMSTLTEIEAAMDALPGPQQEMLLHRLEMKVRTRRPEGGRLVMENGHAVLVAPPGAPAMTPEAVKALLSDFP